MATYTFNNTNTGRSGTIQQWTVPKEGIYRVYARGAKAVTANTGHFGRGAAVQGDLILLKGEVLQILVGQTGQSGSYAGGGGGTFVARGSHYSNAVPLIVAGGGGASGENAGTLFNQGSSDANTYENGRNGTGDSKGLGAANDTSPATTSSTAYCTGSSGGGFYINGQNGSQAQGGKSYGTAFRNGGLGGYNATGGANGTATSYCGGFGGGGGGYDSGGGGGGYRGGGGGGDTNSSTDGSGGGGGSYIHPEAINQKRTAAAGSSHGIVTITELQLASAFNIINNPITNHHIFSVTLNATFEDTTEAFSTTNIDRYFEYGLDANYGNILYAGSYNVTLTTFSYNLAGLLPNTTYYYRSYIEFPDGSKKYSNNATFTTKTGLAILSTDSVASITAETAEAQGTIVGYDE